jgi:hypothetical protein
LGNVTLQAELGTALLQLRTIVLKAARSGHLLNNDMADYQPAVHPLRFMRF